MSRLGRADDKQPVAIDDEVAADFASMCAPVDPALIRKQDDEAFEVWRDNHHALRAFLGTETQWRAAAGVAGIVWLGLDYSAVDVVMRRYHSPDHVFEDLQQMESAALRVFGEASR